MRAACVAVLDALQRGDGDTVPLVALYAALDTAAAAPNELSPLIDYVLAPLLWALPAGPPAAHGEGSGGRRDAAMFVSTGRQRELCFGCISRLVASVGAATFARDTGRLSALLERVAAAVTAAAAPATSMGEDETIEALRTATAALSFVDDSASLFPAAANSALSGTLCVTLVAVVDFVKQPSVSPVLRCRAAQVAAIDTLAAAVSCIGRGPLFVAIVPGIVSALTRVAVGDFKRGSVVTSAALVALSTVVSLEEGRLSDADAGALSSMIEKALTAAARHSHPRVRGAAVRLASTVMTVAPAAREHHSAVIAVEALAVLVEDDIADVSGSAKDAVKATIEGLSPAVRYAVDSELNERAMASFMSLPRVARLADSAALVAALRQCSGFISYRQDGIAVFFDTPGVLDRFVVVLCQVLALAPAKYVTDAEEVIDPTVDEVEYVRKPFEFFVGDSKSAAFGALRRLLHVFGQHLGLRRSVLLLLPFMSSPAVDLAALLVVVNELFGAATDCDASDVEDAANAVLRRFLPLVSDGRPLVSTVALAGIGTCAAALGHSMTDLLVDALFPLVSALAAAEHSVRRAARATLARVAAACGLSSVRDLLHGNVDYIVDAVVSQLRVVREYPNTPAVVEVVVHELQDGSLVVLRDVVTAALRCIDFYSRSDMLQPLLHVARALAAACAKAHGAQCVADATEAVETYLRIEADPLQEVIERTRALAMDDEEATVPPNVGDDDNDNSASPDVGRKECGFALLLDSIARSASHFLCSSDTPVIHLALSVVRECCSSLTGHPRVLRPLLHDAWPSLSQCWAQTAAKPVFNSAIELLVTLACDRSCDSFLFPRLRDDVWPALRAALALDCPWVDRRVSLDLAVAENRKVLSAGHKLHMSVLSGVTSLLQACSEWARTSAWEVMEGNRHVLSAYAPREVRAAGVALFQAVSRADSDALWLFLFHPEARGGRVRDDEESTLRQLGEWFKEQGL